LRPASPYKDRLKLKVEDETLGIRLVDHVIFNKKGYYSFPEHKEISVDTITCKPKPYMVKMHYAGYYINLPAQ
jgi:hypothetical protein